MNEFKKGIATGVILYAVAALSTVVVHYIFGWNVHAQEPPASFMILLFFVLIGLYRLFKTAYLTIRYRGQKRDLGEMIVHLIIFGLLVLSFVYVNFFQIE